MKNDRIAETIQYRGYKILIEYDNETFDFYDDEHLGHFVYRKGYRRGYVGNTPMTEEEAHDLLFPPKEDDDEWCRLQDAYEGTPYNSPEEVIAKKAMEAREEELKEVRRPDIISRSMSVYVHSDYSVRGCDRPADPDEDTDFVYCTHDEAKKFLRVGDDTGPLTEEEIRQAEKILLSEVKELDYWCTGQVYGYHRILDDCDNDVDSCWRFVGESEYCEAEARAACDRLPLLLGTRQQFVDKALKKMGDRPNVRMDDDPRVERIPDTRTAWVQAWALIDLDEE